MCGRIKHLTEFVNRLEREDAFPRGNLKSRLVPYKAKGQEIAFGIWDGAARRENLRDKWAGWENITIPAAAIEENGRELPLQEGARLWGIKKRCGDKDVIKIVTRPPMTKEEKAIYHRWPVQVKQTDEGIVEVPFI